MFTYIKRLFGMILFIQLMFGLNIGSLRIEHQFQNIQIISSSQIKCHCTEHSTQHHKQHSHSNCNSCYWCYFNLIDNLSSYLFDFKLFIRSIKLLFDTESFLSYVNFNVSKPPKLI